MSELNTRELAAEALRALKGENLEAVEPPTVPNLKGLQEPVAAQRRAEYEEQRTKYAEYLLSKSSGALTADEQKFLCIEVARWAREGRN